MAVEAAEAAGGARAVTAAFRLVKAAHAAEAWSGEGARLYGGRWNQPGTRVVYAGDSLALSVLETFVHLGRAQTAIRFVSFRVEIPAAVTIESIDLATLPANWREEPPPDASKEIGTAWARAATSAVLRVPSVIVPIEHNYVFNPAHPDFARIRIGAAEPWSFDPRMWK